MSVILSKYKGSPLTFEELDQNFDELDKKITHIEEAHLPGEGLKEIIQEGDELVFESTFGRCLGRARLPIPLFHHKGMWKARTSYVYGSLVTWQNRVYFCHTSHISEEILCESFWSLLLVLPELFQESTKSHCASAVPFLPALPLYDKEVLPEPTVGSLCLMTDSTGLFMVIGGGDRWHTLQKVA